MARVVNVVMPVQVPFPVLATARLRLRPFRLDDVDAMHACYGDAEVMRFWDRPAHERRSQTERVVRRSIVYAPGKQLRWAVEEADGGQCIGMVNYHNVDPAHRKAEIGYLLRRDRWGKGLGHEAVGAVLGHCFGKLKLHRVQAITDPENAASRKLLEGFGFTLEGVVREALLLGGAWRDNCIYGMLDREWKGGAKT